MEYAKGKLIKIDLDLGGTLYQKIARQVFYENKLFTNQQVISWMK